MSELNNNVEVDTVECENEGVAEMTRFDKAKAGFKKHGKTIGLVVAGVTLGIIGYALGARKSSCDDDYDGVVYTYNGEDVEEIDDEKVE